MKWDDSTKRGWRRLIATVREKPRGILLLVHRRLGIWLQPGGHVDPGETPWEAARRETVEETGTVGATFDFKPATFLFEARYALQGQPPSYDVGPDGRFLMIKSAGESRTDPPMVVVLNWDQELKRLVAAN